MGRTISETITIYNETDLQIPLNTDEAQKVIALVSEKEDRPFEFVEVVFVDETGIITINKKFLDRDYVTDIISFHYTEDQNANIEGTLYCCAPRIMEQADEFNQPHKTEFFRILIHGLLHLVGYDDQTVDEKKGMRKKENFYLNLLSLPYEK